MEKKSEKVTTSRGLTPRSIVRRYLDLPRYLDLLRSRALYMRRADRFNDPCEGALTPALREAIDGAYLAHRCEHDADSFCRRSKVGNFVSCWSLGAHDNMALWQLYGGARASLAITSTVDKLIDVALSWGEYVHISRVRYIDHFKNPDMIIGRYFDLLEFKHKAYKYEQEVRIILPRQGDEWINNPLGIRLPVNDLNALIRCVVVAPEAGEWFFELVEDVTRKYGIRAPIKKSKLAELPAVDIVRPTD